jgi:hypothetical protein
MRRSGVMPKWAMIVPTINEATTTLTNVRRKPWNIRDSSLPGGPSAAVRSP